MFNRRRQSARQKSRDLEERFKQGQWDLAPERIAGYILPTGLLALLVALLSLSFAVLYALVVTSVLPAPLDMDAPPFVHGCTVVAFLVTAAVLGRWALECLWFRWRRWRGRIGNRSAALADYPWDPTGIKDRAHVEPLRRLWWAVFLLLLIFPVGWWAFFSDKDELFLLGPMVIVFSVGWFVMATLSFMSVPAYMREGRGSIRFDQFPYHPGDRLRLEFTPNMYPNPRFTLRFVDQATVEDSRSYGGLTVRYSKRELPLIHALDDAVCVEFDLPDDPALVTSLSGPVFRYWELRVDVQSPKYDYETSFPLPVYPSPESSQQAGESLERKRAPG